MQWYTIYEIWGVRDYKPPVVFGEITLEIINSTPPSTEKRDHKFMDWKLPVKLSSRVNGSPHFPSVGMGFVLHRRKLVLWSMKRNRTRVETQHFLAGECKLWVKVQDHRCFYTNTSKNSKKMTGSSFLNIKICKKFEYSKLHSRKL